MCPFLQASFNLVFLVKSPSAPDSQNIYRIPRDIICPFQFGLPTLQVPFRVSVKSILGIASSTTCPQHPLHCKLNIFHYSPALYSFHHDEEGLFREIPRSNFFSKKKKSCSILLLIFHVSDLNSMTGVLYRLSLVCLDWMREVISLRRPKYTCWLLIFFSSPRLLVLCLGSPLTPNTWTGPLSQI